jgi:hypothetical protein
MIACSTGSLLKLTTRCDTIRMTVPALCKAEPETDGDREREREGLSPALLLPRLLPPAPVSKSSPKRELL